jgi:SpoVK/Ycf46/Vps4 family AAA+-type ATPase
VSVNQQVIAAVRSRNGRKAEFGYGVTTADKYVSQVVKAMPGCVDADLEKEAAYKLVACNQDMVTEEKATNEVEWKKLVPSGVDVPKGTMMVFRHVITTPREDRDKDVLLTEGATLDPKAPLLWQHMHVFPIGKVLAKVQHDKNVLRAVSAIIEMPGDLGKIAGDAVSLVEAEVMRISHGFNVSEFEPRKQADDEEFPGFLIRGFEIMEVSLVSIPSNVDAEIELFSAGKLKSDLFQKHAKYLADQRPVQKQGWTVTASWATDVAKVVNDKDTAAELQKIADDLQDKLRTKQHIVDKLQRPKVTQVAGPDQKHFDVAKEHLEACTLEYDWCAKFLGCNIKDMIVTGTYVPNVRRGSWFTGAEVHMANYELHDHRHLTDSGKEMPPMYEDIQLNSKSRQTFMVDGIQFWQNDKDKLCVVYYQTWGGNYVTTYAVGDEGQRFIDHNWEWSKNNNFLKGEKFTLSGEFLAKTSETIDDVILEEENAKPVRSVIKLINEKGKELPNRGMVMCGPPGTGKTLSGRVIMNETNATFIWVNARHMSSMGAVGAFCHGLDLAKELAPSVLFVEDVDNYLGKHTVDVLKSELDGISRSQGVVTCLTTNEPQNLPASLVDRPGRFHDVLEYKLPTLSARRAMIARFALDMFSVNGVKGLDADLVLEIAKETDNYSGAHLYELVYFATIIQTEEECEAEDAFMKAIEKITTQRTLLLYNQTAGGSYRRDAKSFAKPSVKAGRVISEANLKKLVSVKDDMESLKDMTLPRAGEALCERCITKLDSVIKSASKPEDNTDDPKTVAPDPTHSVTTDGAAVSTTNELLASVLTCDASNEQLKRLRDAIDAIVEVEELDSKAEEYRKLTRAV